MTHRAPRWKDSENETKNKAAALREKGGCGPEFGYAIKNG
jgi:hypothetical protein